MRTVEAVFLAAALAVLPVVVADAAETCTELSARVTPTA